MQIAERTKRGMYAADVHQDSVRSPLLRDLADMVSDIAAGRRVLRLLPERLDRDHPTVDRRFSPILSSQPGASGKVSPCLLWPNESYTIEYGTKAPPTILVIQSDERNRKS